MGKSQKEAIERLRAQVHQANVAARGNEYWGMELSQLEEEALAYHGLGKPKSGWVNPYPTSDPRSLLLEYQFPIFHDRSRAKISIQSRQTGKDFTSEGEAADDCNARPGTQWMIAGPSERQALDSLDQGKVWAEAFDLVVEDFKTENETISGESLLKSAEILFSNGSRMRAVPGKPDTVRGRSASILLTEFDFFENPAATWRAILPSITNKLRGGEKKVRLITTPNGKGSQTDKLYHKRGGKFGWSKWMVTIYHAVLMGLDVDIQELREIIDDPDGWAQEFECRFLDTQSVLLPYDLLKKCEDGDLQTDINFECLRHSSNNFYFGIDIGRKKDLTVIWILEDQGGRMVTRGVKVFDRTPFREQLKWMVDLLRAYPKLVRGAVDSNGIGAMIAEELAIEFGSYRVEEFTFTQQSKEAIFLPLKDAFEDDRIRIPENKVIREDLHGLQKIVSTTGAVRFHAPSNADGHCDRATALALANHAGTSMIVVPTGPIPIRRTGMPSGRGFVGSGNGRAMYGLRVLEDGVPLWVPMAA